MEHLDQRRSEDLNNKYRQTTNISRTLVGNKLFITQL